MNYQRKVIFHQRMEWMKDEAINEIVATGIGTTQQKA
jgi:hypothetical protein